MKFIWLLLLLSLSVPKASAQLPEHWRAPTSVPVEGSNRIILYTNNSAQVALKIVANLLKTQGFQVDFHDRIGITTPYKVITEITRMRGSGAITMTMVISQEIPGILTLSGSSISQATARKIFRESHSKKDEEPHMQKSKASESAFRKASSEAT